MGGTDLGYLPDPSRYRASTVGFVFQFHYLIPTLSARKNVQVPMIGRGLPRRESVASRTSCFGRARLGIGRRRRQAPSPEESASVSR